MNLIDVVSGKTHIQQYAGQAMDNVIEFLLGAWTDDAISDYLQMDNSAFVCARCYEPFHLTK